MASSTTHSQSQTNGKDMDGLREKAEDMVDAASKAVEETAISAQLHGEKALQDAKKAVTTAHGSAVDVIRKNPTTALVGALGVGVLLGLALRGRG